MPSGGHPPFTSALPQAALANPDGPLAFIGHVDLAWTSTFSDEGNLAHSRFLGVLQALSAGRRAGNALHTLLRFFGDALNELKMLYNQEELELATSRKLSADPARAAQWMLCQDLANYVLLGDPAVRIPGLSAQK
ncbi:C25 family cysteine peptidase [Stigmatella sp. ncwal1]|uniref:C25 family cysteine peptidase n=1 Tax=Stigmatella ashevillensis TaxID=2995309 RepID=A0ABT5D7I0_9BACT|nr:C25 family cysteine peptidase [Stigmatella ashevillena]MDC0709615.1 C25 family cysteine peptidase [Stigmatella ashevillena]